MQAPRGVRAACWLLALAAYAGCAGDGPPPDAPSGQFDALQREIFNVNCLSAGCHNPQSRAGGMVLAEGEAYDNLVGVEPNNPVAADAGLLRVDPFQPDNSFILIKLRGPGPGEGSRMPLGRDPLPESDIAAIEAWIRDGAPRGNPPTPTPTPIPPDPARP